MLELIISIYEYIYKTIIFTLAYTATFNILL
nr:MAG TPA: hypothetical protein [Caudoviricetes sp.]